MKFTIVVLFAVSLIKPTFAFETGNAEAPMISDRMKNKLDKPLLSPTINANDKSLLQLMNPNTKYLINRVENKSGSDAMVVVPFADESTDLSSHAKRALESLVMNVKRSEPVNLTIEVVNKVTLAKGLSAIDSDIEPADNTGSGALMSGTFYNSLPSETQARADNIVTYLELLELKFSDITLDYIDANEEIMQERTTEVYIFDDSITRSQYLGFAQKVNVLITEVENQVSDISLIQ